MKIFHRMVFSALLLCLTPISNSYVLADDGKNFTKFLSDPAEQRRLFDVVQQSGVVAHAPCSSSTVRIMDQLAIYKPLVFDNAARPTAGAWKLSVVETGCGYDRILNAVFWVDSDGSIKGIPLLPGTTRADFILQNDAMMYAAMGADWSEEDYKLGYVENTEFLRETGEPLEGVKAKPWDELWTLTLPTKKAQVIMHFIPDKTGTTISTPLNKTKFLPNTPAN